MDSIDIYRENFYRRLRKLGHVLRVDEDGLVDQFVCEGDGHNGPGCVLCGDFWCQWCPLVTEKPCPGSNDA
jgi:hypothetical protein